MTDSQPPIQTEVPWRPIDSAPEGIVVRTAIIDHEQRNTADLIRKGRLWFFPDMSMYVYYTPTHWRPA